MKSNYHHPTKHVNVYQTKDKGKGRGRVRQPQREQFRHGGVTETERSTPDDAHGERGRPWHRQAEAD